MKLLKSGSEWGLGIGKILALEWNDFNYAKIGPTINKTLIWIKDELEREALKVQTTMKTDSSLRTVQVCRSNSKLLKELKKRRVTDGFADNGIIFCSTRGVYFPKKFELRAGDSLYKSRY